MAFLIFFVLHPGVLLYRPLGLHITFSCALEYLLFVWPMALKDENNSQRDLEGADLLAGGGGVDLSSSVRGIIILVSPKAAEQHTVTRRRKGSGLEK